MKQLTIGFLFSMMAILVSGCAVVATATKYAAKGAAMAGVISHDDSDSVGRTADGMKEASKEFTPEQKHYIGRAVGATMLQNYKVYDNPALHRYVNTIGQVLATVSEMPTTFRGYRFLLLDTEEVNAFAVPGGTVLITRGLIKCCKTEDELAAVLAHEIAHVQHDHGTRAIKKGRWAKVFAIVGTEVVRAYTSDEVAAMAEQLEGSVADIADKMTSGYDKGWEFQADASAVGILRRMGYAPAALRNMLKVLEGRTAGKKKGFGDSHPLPKKRIEKVNKLLTEKDAAWVVPARSARFRKAMEGV